MYSLLFYSAAGPRSSYLTGVKHVDQNEELNFWQAQERVQLLLPVHFTENTSVLLLVTVFLDYGISTWSTSSSTAVSTCIVQVRAKGWDLGVTQIYPGCTGLTQVKGAKVKKPRVQTVNKTTKAHSLVAMTTQQTYTLAVSQGRFLTACTPKEGHFQTGERSVPGGVWVTAAAQWALCTQRKKTASSNEILGSHITQPRATRGGVQQVFISLKVHRIWKQVTVHLLK